MKNNERSLLEKVLKQGVYETEASNTTYRRCPFCDVFTNDMDTANHKKDCSFLETKKGVADAYQVAKKVVEANLNYSEGEDGGWATDCCKYCEGECTVNNTTMDNVKHNDHCLYHEAKSLTTN